MKMQAMVGGHGGDSAVTGHRTTVRIDRRVVRLDANNNNNNNHSSFAIANTNSHQHVYLNLRQRPSSPPHHRLLRLTTEVEGDETARMSGAQVLKLCVTLLILGGLPLNVALMVESKTLNVGEELWKEILPLQMGSRLYNLKGLKSNTWYEVKISYPASIPSRFSLQLKKGSSELGLNHKRKLLNTEKLIFKTDNLDLLHNQEEMYVLVIVEPEGVVAMTSVYERKEVVFNIVCDELLLGIPHHAYLVALFVLICFGLALILPIFLPLYLLREDGRSSQNQNASKDS